VRGRERKGTEEGARRRTIGKKGDEGASETRDGLIDGKRRGSRGDFAAAETGEPPRADSPHFSRARARKVAFPHGHERIYGRVTLADIRAAASIVRSSEVDARDTRRDRATTFATCPTAVPVAVSLLAAVIVVTICYYPQINPGSSM